LLRESAAGQLALYAPRQIEVEVVAALRRAVLNGRIPRSALDAMMASWLGPLHAQLRLADNAHLLPAALPRALSLGTTLFDALYVVLAEELGAHLIVADERLLRGSVAGIPSVRPLRTYLSET
jgi:predicted nucleic acid-binding protein